MKEVYNIGLDIGTSSVGYAMTDEKGRLLRFHKRPTYGSVLFEEAQTAKERRQKRSARRRLARRRKRIKLLQALVAPDVCAADPAFFLRMNESFLWFFRLISIFSNASFSSGNKLSFLSSDK